MVTDICNVIERIYIKEDHSFFIAQCQRKLDFIDALLENLRDRLKNIRLCDNPGDPSAEVIFDLDHFFQSEFKVQYTSILLVSKIHDIFYLQHGFAVDNLDINRMCSVLDGFGDQAYSKQQYDLEKIVTDYLYNLNYKKMKYAEMVEVIPMVDMPTNCIFGSQMTVENALFKDVWNICP